MENHRIQGSQAWLDYRLSRIGSSDAATIAGFNPWKTPMQLYNEKINNTKTFVNDAMKKGTKLEPVARAAYEELTGQAMFPDVVEHPNHEWMIASLDGISLDKKRVVEIKCCV
jgi:putative phage-type endonuclease